MPEKINRAMCHKVEDLCGLLGISRPTAYELVHREDFPKVRVGRRLLIPRAGLEEWLKQQCSMSNEGGAA